MNQKIFYFIKTFQTCKFFPTELIELIWNLVRDDAADAIRRIYMFKVARNCDIFSHLIKINNTICNTEEFENYMNIMSTKITYKYIQEPSRWIDTIENIYNNCCVLGQTRRLFIIDNIISNIIFTSDRIDLAIF